MDDAEQMTACDARRNEKIEKKWKHGSHFFLCLRGDMNRGFFIQYDDSSFQSMALS